jgi:hypothetical protein
MGMEADCASETSFSLAEIKSRASAASSSVAFSVPGGETLGSRSETSRASVASPSVASSVPGGETLDAHPKIYVYLKVKGQDGCSAHFKINKTPAELNMEDDDVIDER